MKLAVCDSNIIKAIFHKELKNVILLFKKFSDYDDYNVLFDIFQFRTLVKISKNAFCKEALGYKSHFYL